MTAPASPSSRAQTLKRPPRPHVKAALRALHAGDPLAAVARARHHDDQAREAAKRARVALHAAIVHAVAAGAAPATSSPPPASPDREHLHVDERRRPPGMGRGWAEPPGVVGGGG